MQSLSNQSNEKDRLLEYHQPWPPPPQRKTLPTNLHFPSRTNITGEHKYLCYIHLLGSIPVHLNIRHQVTTVPSLSSHPTWGTGSDTTEERDGKKEKPVELQLWQGRGGVGRERGVGGGGVVGGGGWGGGGGGGGTWVQTSDLETWDWVLSKNVLRVDHRELR